MTIENELRNALIGMSAVTEIVGQRIWDEWFRQNEYPAIVFEFDTEEQENGLDGTGGLIFAEVNIVCRANTREASRALAEAVRTNGTDPGSGLAGYSGTFDAWLDSRSLSATPKEDGSNAHWYDTNMGFILSWSEAQ